MKTMLAYDLAKLARQLREEVSDVRNQALIRQCLIDAAAAALAGYDSVAAQAATRFAVRALGAGNFSPWFSDSAAVTALGASFINSSAMSSLDIDDGNRAARGHLGAAIIPTVSAFGRMYAVSAEAFSHAILAGCEIGARLGAAELPAYSASGRWAGVGAAVSLGICLDFDEESLANAISLAVHAAPLMGSASRRLQMTGHIKEGVPFGVLSGISSALLADEGYRGDPDAIESVGIYDIHRLSEQPLNPLTFARTYFKRYTCCRLAHAPIDAAVSIAEREHLNINDVDRITVHTFRTAIELPNEARPTSFESAQFSLPFSIAVALVRGADALLPLSVSSLVDHEVLALSERIVLKHDSQLDSLYPSGTPTRVHITTHGGLTYEEQRDTADGDPGRPFSDSELVKKMETLGRGKVSIERLATIAGMLQTRIPNATEFDASLHK